MQFDYPLNREPATSEWALAVIQDFYRQASHFDPDVYSGERLSFETTVEDWRIACSLDRWQTLGQAYNEIFEINCSDVQWCEALEPPHKKTLRDVCELIAAHAQQPVVRPASVLGTRCLSAGVFLTIRSVLTHAGSDASEIVPSTPLGPYIRHHWKPILSILTRIAPGALPPIRIRTPVYDALVWCLLVAMLFGVTCAFLQSVIGLCASFTFGLIFYFAINAAAKLPPASVDFGDLKTFRDLSMIFANGAISNQD